MRVVGIVLHPERDCTGAVGLILEWADRRDIQVVGIDTEVRRLACTAEAVTAAELRQRADLLVSLGGDGTMLRAMRLADMQRAPVLGVNLGKLGFLAEVDVPDLPDALSAIENHEFTTEPRLAVDAVIGGQLITAFNDIAFVRFPGQKTAAIAVEAAGRPFVSYAADAIVVATPTGSTAYSFSAGGPIVSPAVEALLVTPAAPHSAYNRGLVVSVGDQLTLNVLPSSGRLAVEADGNVAAEVEPGDRIELVPRPGAATPRSTSGSGASCGWRTRPRSPSAGRDACRPLGGQQQVAAWQPPGHVARQPRSGTGASGQGAAGPDGPGSAVGVRRRAAEHAGHLVPGPAHPGDRGLGVLAEFLRDPGRAAQVAKDAGRRVDRPFHLHRARLVGDLQYGCEERVGPGGIDAQVIGHGPHRGPPFTEGF
jgi:NAD+ kinase